MVGFCVSTMYIWLCCSDFDECVSSQFHDCSEHSHCFNLRGTYTCSCKEGFADLSENPLFPGRACSAELVGCDKCHYHGTCYSRGEEQQQMCECFQWYSGENCQVNLKGRWRCVYFHYFVLFLCLGTGIKVW